MAFDFDLKRLLTSAEKTEGADVVPLHKPPSLDKLSSVITTKRNDLVKCESLLAQLEAVYAENKELLVADVRAAEASLYEALKSFYDETNKRGIPVGEAPQRA